MQHPSLEFLGSLNQTGLIIEHDQKFYGVILAIDEQSADMSAFWANELKNAKNDGLSGVAIMRPNRTIYLESCGEV